MQPRTDAWYAEMDVITRDLTGYDSFEKLCLAHPTLRILPNVSADYRIKMLRLRAAYFQETGRHADSEIAHNYRYTVVTKDGQAYFGNTIGETLMVEEGRWIDHRRRRIGRRNPHIVVWTEYSTPEQFIAGLRKVDAWLHSTDRRRDGK